MAKNQSDLERSFETWWRVLAPPEAPQPEREVRFHDQRRWRFDYAFIDQKVAIELEGGIYSGGRHTRPKGYIGDLVKYNTAVELGWRVLRFSGDMLADDPGKVVQQVLNVLGIPGNSAA